MRIVRRAEWSARSPKRQISTVPITNRTATCVHHAGSTVVTIRDFAGACAYVRGDQNYHMDHNDWDDIGYNYLVISAPAYPDIDGLVFEGRGRDAIGAHCLNWNTPWIGIQIAIGGKQQPSQLALESTRWLHDDFSIAAHKQLGMKVHSDGFNTECPGPELLAWTHAGMHTTTRLPPVVIKPKPNPAPGVIRYPVFALPSGHYYGVTSPSPYCHSGLLSTVDRQQILKYQTQMYNRGWRSMPRNSHFDQTTANVTKQFQLEKRLTVDSRVGPQTWIAAWTTKVT